MRFVIKLIFGLFLFLLLIGRNLPFDKLFVSGLGPWDLLAMGLFPFLNYKVVPLRIYRYLIGFFFFAIIGVVLNLHIGSRLNDIFEISRIFYSIELISLGYIFAKYLGNDRIIDIIFLSSFCVFIFAYINPMNPDVLGFVQIWNPNVVGNYLIHCTILVIILSDKLSNKKIIYCCLLLTFSFFTYSKASWLMMVLISGVLFINFSNFNKVIFLGILILGVNANIEYLSAINTLINAKIDASGFEGSAASGSSVGARIGLAYSGFLMFLENPLFGVGIGNFEIINDSLKSTLGDMFYKDDNANSLFFHYLGTTGLLGFSTVFLLIFQYFKLLTSSVKSISIYLIVIVFILVSINFQRELFTTNTMYLLIGILIFKNKLNNENSCIKSVN